MDKTWSVTLYRDGKPASERQGVSSEDALAQIYRLSLTSAPFAEIEDQTAPDTGELQLIAA